MPTATATAKKKTTSPADSLRNLNRDMLRQAAADWRRWAIDIADGKGAPDARELLAAAAALDIEDAAEALQADADAILEVRTAENNIELCRRTTDNLLDPWGGSLDKLAAAVIAAQAEVDRLKALHGQAEAGCSRSFWVDMSHRLRVGHPRVWASYNDSISAKGA